MKKGNSNKRLKELFDIIGIEERGMAKLLGVTVGTISGYVNGKSIPASFLEKLSSVLPVDTNWILTGSGEPLPKDFDPTVLKVEKKHHVLKAESRGVSSEIIDRIVQVRKSLDLTQKEFSESIGFERHTQASMESYRQNPSPFYLQQLALKFRINMNWVIIGHGEMKMSDSKSQDDLMKQVETKDKIIKQLLEQLED